MKPRQTRIFLQHAPRFGHFIPSRRVENFLYSLTDPDEELLWRYCLEYVAGESFHRRIADRMLIPGACAYSVVSTAVSPLLPNFHLVYSVERYEGDFLCRLDGFTMGKVPKRVQVTPITRLALAA